MRPQRLTCLKKKFPILTRGDLFFIFINILFESKKCCQLSRQLRHNILTTTQTKTVRIVVDATWNMTLVLTTATNNWQRFASPPLLSVNRTHAGPVTTEMAVGVTWQKSFACAIIIVNAIFIYHLHCQITTFSASIKIRNDEMIQPMAISNSSKTFHINLLGKPIGTGHRICNNESDKDTDCWITIQRDMENVNFFFF